MEFQKKVLLVFIVIFNIYFGFSQNGVAIYKISPLTLVDYKNKKIGKISKSYFKALEGKKEKAANFIEYKLEFNKKDALFYMEDLMESEYEKSAKYFKVGNIYVFSNMKIREKEQYGSSFLITSTISNVKWNLTNVTKKIGKYTCYKATTVKTIINPVGTFYRNITAWYSLDLPFAFGPMGYGNLPGLIVELRIDKKGVYTLKSITLNPKEPIIIKNPTKGKRVTEKEFDEIGRKAYLRRRNGM